ncbi:hypothetical protein [Spirosoma daeguense]
MSRLLIICFVLSFCVTACGPDRVKYTSELKQEIADSKIKRVTDVDLVETVDNLGGKISSVVQKELITQLQQTTDPAKRAQLCQLQNLPRTKAIAERYAVEIRLLGVDDLKNVTLNAKEREILDAYYYSAKQKQAAMSNIQKINDTLFVYNVPVPAQNAICEACFGKQDVPFAVWHFGFQKREVVRRMSASKK